MQNKVVIYNFYSRKEHQRARIYTRRNRNYTIGIYGSISLHGCSQKMQMYFNMKKSIESIVRHSEVSEKAIEAYLNRQAKENNLLCLKYANANVTGYPDRLICIPGGKVVWVELKSKGKTPTKLQQIRHAELQGIGHRVLVISSKEQVDNLISGINNEIEKAI